jgi:cellulose synthase (UDP-forming)
VNGVGKGGPNVAAWPAPFNLPAHQAHRLTVLVYLAWRASTWARVGSVAEALVVGLSFGAELLLVVASMRVLEVMAKTKERSSEVDAHAGWWKAGNAPAPVVDVLIPTYNEERHVLERTIAGALNQDYERSRVWVLDDGDRGWLEALCRELGVGYLTRVEHSGAKPGNLNAALAKLETLEAPPQFLAVVDADFVLQRGFVSRTLALMHDTGVAIVQTPQFFYNPDNFQNSVWPLQLPDALRFSQDILLPARDASGNAYCCGTSFLARVQALRASNGFPVESVADDFWLSFQVRMAGWRIVYLNELLSFGVATERLGIYLVQRARWALGYAQIVRLQWRVRTSGRTLWKRWVATEGYLRYAYTATARLVLVSVPVLYWWAGIPASNGSSGLAIACALPMLVLNRLVLTRASQGRHLPFYTDAVSLVGAVAVTRGALSGLLRPSGRRFIVTDKGFNQSKREVHGRTLGWTLGLALLLVVGMSVDPAAPPGHESRPELLAMSVWTIAALLTLALAAVFCVNPPRPRAEERFLAPDERVAVRIGSDGPELDATLIDGCPSGLRLRCPSLGAPSTSLEVFFGEACGWVKAGVVRRCKDGTFGVRLEPTDRQRYVLNAKFYATPYVRPIRKPRLFGSAPRMGWARAQL